VGDVSHDVADEVRLLRSGAAAPLARDVVRVVGPDAEQFLGGQLSADLSALAPEEGAWSLLCEPTGKLGWWLRISRLGADEFLLDVDSGYGEVVVARLQRFLLRTDATIALEPSDAWVALAVRGPREVRLDHEAGATVLTLPSPWPGLLGWDVLAPTDAHVRLDLDVVSADALHALRVECGVPAHGAEITDGTIAAELGQWLIDASVSFTKGCYVGQELVARIDSRGGNVPRHLRAVLSPSGVSVGDEVVDGERVVGVVTSVAVSPSVGPVGLALVGRGVGPPAEVGLRGPAGERPGEVRAVPVVDDLLTGPGVSVSLGGD
jgi:folate-binding protein YgfZ